MNHNHLTENERNELVWSLDEICSDPAALEELALRVIPELQFHAMQDRARTLVNAACSKCVEDNLIREAHICCPDHHHIWALGALRGLPLAPPPEIACLLEVYQAGGGLLEDLLLAGARQIHELPTGERQSVTHRIAQCIRAKRLSTLYLLAALHPLKYECLQARLKRIVRTFSTPREAIPEAWDDMDPALKARLQALWPDRPDVVLTRLQRQQLHDAMLDAFRTQGELAQMMRHQLDINLHSLTGGVGLEQAIFEILEWAKVQGRMRDVLNGARSTVPRNLELHRIVHEILGEA